MTRTGVFGTVVLLALIASMVIFFRHKIANQFARAGGRHTMENHLAAPLDLSDLPDRSTSTFRKAPVWKGAPIGFQTFDHVPLQIDGFQLLWGSGNAESGAVFPEQVLGIAVNRRFETLYVYHCTFFGSPYNTPVYDLVFRYDDAYDDGYSVTNTIRYGVDTLDFNTRGSIKDAAPTSTNSKVAWVGGSFTPDGKRPLCFILTAIENPKPFLLVKSIDLYSCKNRSAGVVLAMTTGKSGLMK